MAQTIGGRIDELRHARDLSVADVAELIGVTRQTMSNYIAGRQVISSSDLAVLARMFGKSLDFFLGDDSYENMTLMFRTEKADSVPDEILGAVLQSFTRYVEALSLADVKTAFVPPTYSLKLEGKSTLTEGDRRAIEEVANRLRSLLGLEGVFGPDLFMGLEDAGINIVASPYEASIWAMSAYSPRLGSFIWVNDCDSISEERKIFSLIHELGHLVLHRENYIVAGPELRYTSRRNSIQERAADHFAGCFLLPRKRLSADPSFKGVVTLNRVIAAKNRYRVSVQSLIMALGNYGLISRQESKSLFATLNRRMGGLTKEPKPLPHFEKDQKLKAIVQQLYLDGAVGISKVAELMGCSLMDARRSAKEWGVGS